LIVAQYLNPNDEESPCLPLLGLPARSAVAVTIGAVRPLGRAKQGTVDPHEVSKEARMSLTVAELLADTLDRIRVKQIFGLIGDALNPICGSVSKLDPFYGQLADGSI
jgi:hypothetical protein